MKFRNIVILGSIAGLSLVMLAVAALLLAPMALARGPVFDGNPDFSPMGSGPMMRQMSGQMLQDGSGYGPGSARLGMNRTGAAGPMVGQEGAFGPMAGRGGHRGMGGPQNSLVAVVAEQLGMERTDLIAELQSGKTMAEVITAQGRKIEAIIDAFVAQRQERLDTMVENDQLTREQADALQAMMRAKVTESINNEWSPQGRGNGQGFVDEDGDGVCDHAGQGRGQGTSQAFGRGAGQQGGGMMGRWANVY